MWGLSSYHPGGANVLMCDGSVRFLKNSTNQATIWALGSRAQGEVISSDSYRSVQADLRAECDPGVLEHPSGYRHRE